MPSSQIRVDVFPAVLTLKGEDGEPATYDKARVIITLDHVYVFQDASPNPEIVFEDRLTSYTPPIPATRVRKASQLLERYAVFETEDGYNGSFLRSGSCGCGSRLKNVSASTLLPDNQIPQIVSSLDS